VGTQPPVRCLAAPLASVDALDPVPKISLTPDGAGNVGEMTSQPIGIEVGSGLAIACQRESGYFFYTPAPRNVYLQSNVMSLYRRFQRHIPRLRGDDEPRTLVAVIDIGSHDAVRTLMASGTTPGIFLRPPEASSVQNTGVARNFAYEDGGEVQIFQTHWLFFVNGTLPVGLGQFRTMCQLFAAFCCATVIRIYGPGASRRDIKLSSPLFDRESQDKLTKNLVAIYGTLLTVGPKYFNYAVRTLEDTRKNIDPFRYFLQDLDNEWFDINKDTFLPADELKLRYQAAHPA
jgi:hypothetical protein